MKNFYISHSEEDRKWAEWITYVLDEAGYTFTHSQWDAFLCLVHDDSTMIRSALQEADRVMCLLSPSFFKQGSIHRLRMALDDPEIGDKIVLVRIADWEIDPSEELPYIDLVDLSENEAKERLLSGLRQNVIRTVPFPAQIGHQEPTIWQVPERNRVAKYMEPEGVLDQVRARLTETRAVIVTANPGAGKTTVALSYLYKYAKEYNIVCWLDAGSKASLVSDLVKLGEKMRIPKRKSSKPSEMVQAVLNRLSQMSNWLLIYDGLDEPDLERYRPDSGAGHVLITSRNSNVFGGEASVIHLNAMDRAQSIEYLLSRTKQEERDTANEIAMLCGDLPLALDVACRSITRYELSLERYVDLLRFHHVQLLELEEKHALPSYTLALPLLIEIERLETYRRGYQLLGFCAFSAPEEGVKVEWLSESGYDALYLDVALFDLEKRDLIVMQNAKILVPGLVRDVVMQRLGRGERITHAMKSYQLVEKRMRFEAYSLQSVENYADILPVAYKLLSETMQYLLVDGSAIAGLYHRVAKALFLSEEWRKAENIVELGVTLVNEISLPDPVDVIGLLHIQGKLEAKRGNHRAALEHFESVHDFLRRKGELEQRDHLLIKVLVDLCDSLECLEMFQDAAFHMMMLETLYEDMYSADHPLIRDNLYRMGTMHYKLQQWHPAYTLCGRAFELYRLYNDWDSKAIGCLIKLGDICTEEKKYVEAQAHYEAALLKQTELFGTLHPRTGILHNKLGTLQMREGDHQEALLQLKLAYEVYRSLYGEDHSQVAIILNNLGNVYLSMGDTENAIHCFEQANESFNRLFGAEHIYSKMTAERLKHSHMQLLEHLQGGV